MYRFKVKPDDMTFYSQEIWRVTLNKNPSLEYVSIGVTFSYTLLWLDPVYDVLRPKPERDIEHRIKVYCKLLTLNPQVTQNGVDHVVPVCRLIGIFGLCDCTDFIYFSLSIISYYNIYLR